MANSPNRCGRIAKMLTLDADAVPLLAQLAGSTKMPGTLVSELIRGEVDRRRLRQQWLEEQRQATPHAASVVMD